MYPPFLFRGQAFVTILWAALAASLLAGCATISQRDREVLRQHHVPPPLQERMVNLEMLALPEIVLLSRLQVPPDYLIRYIDNSLGEYQLTTRDVLHLRESHVNEKVIDYLLTTGPSEMVVVNRPYWPDYPRTVIIRRDQRHHHRR